MVLKDTIRSIWGKRYVRTLTYLLAGGAVVGVVAHRVVIRTYGPRWVIQKLQTIVLEETGLPLALHDIQLDLLQGKVKAYQLGLGEDLLQADAISLSVDAWNMMKGQLHIKTIEITQPRILLDKKRLARLRLKARQSQGKVFWKVDTLRVKDGYCQVIEPAWGIPPLETHFSLQGKGLRYNQLDFTFDTQQLTCGSEKGQVHLEGELNDEQVVLAQGGLRLGESSTQVKGSYGLQGGHVKASATGALESGPLARLFLPKQTGLPVGRFTFQGEAEGPYNALTWQGELAGKDVTLPKQPLSPLQLQLSANGSPGNVFVHRLDCRCAQGNLHAVGHWQEEKGGRLNVTAKYIDLHQLVKQSRVPFLRRTVATLETEVTLPPGDFSEKHLQQLQAEGEALLWRDGAKSGQVTLALSRGQCVADHIQLAFPELFFQGRATVSLASLKPVRVEAEGTVDTNATQVAATLQAWDIGDKRDGRVLPFQMAGFVHAKSHITWTPRAGLLLQGDCEVESPRWHGAQGDWLQAKVEIERDDLRLRELRLNRDGGHANGDLWLTWGKLPPNAKQIEMHYTVVNLPVREGLKAADIDLPLNARGSGTVAIAGPYERLTLQGSAHAEHIQYANFTSLPVVSSDFMLDLGTDRMTLKRIKVGESLDKLGEGEDIPSGPVAFAGFLDVDLQKSTWTGELNGRLDTQALQLSGPRLQVANITLRPAGHWVAPFGPLKMPDVRIAFDQAQLWADHYHFEGIGGEVAFHEGTLQGRLNLGSGKKDLITLQGKQVSDTMHVTAHVKLDNGTAQTAHWAKALTHDMLNDVALEAEALLDYGQQGITWKGTLAKMDAMTSSFTVGLKRPGQFEGDLTRVRLDLGLLGHSDHGGDLVAVNVKGDVPLNGQGRVNLATSGDAELSKLKPFMDHIMGVAPYSLLGDLRPTGNAQFNITIGGTLQDPTLNGKLRLQEGSLKVRTYPQSIENFEMTLLFKDKEVLLPKEEPAWGVMAQGDFKAWGKATWGMGGLKDYRLKARLEDFELRDLPEGMELSGTVDASLTGSDEGGFLKGNVVLDRAYYTAEFKLMDILMDNVLEGSTGFEADPSEALSKIALDLNVSLRKPLTCETNFFKVQGLLPNNSPLKIKGTLLQPALQGRIKFIEGGRITNVVPAGDVVLERGALTFDASAPITNPLVDILGKVDVAPYVITLQVSGNVDRLQVQATSTPGLRQDEIFTLLTDPASVATIGTLSSSSSDLSKGLGKTAADLVTTLALADIEGRFRRAFGLDRVNVSYRSTESTITVGKTFSLFGRHVPFVYQQRRSGDLVTHSGRFEFRFGNFVMSLGGTQTGASSMQGAGDMHYSWTTR